MLLLNIGDLKVPKTNKKSGKKHKFTKPKKATLAVRKKAKQKKFIKQVCDIFNISQVASTRIKRDPSTCDRDAKKLFSHTHHNSIFFATIITS